MDVRDRKFPRLLSREEFPYDQRHKNNESLAGDPGKEKDILFNVKENNFVIQQDRKSQTWMGKLSSSKTAPIIGKENLSAQDQHLKKGLSYA